MKITRNTIAKTEIRKLISTSPVALSQPEIQQALNDVCDRVTIYRVLDRLVDEGAVHRIVNVDGVIKYAECHQCETQHHHHNHVHFSCEKCKAVTCLEDVEPTFKLPKQYQVKEVNFTLSGLCPNCS
ncbi:Fur family transcriptional regulator [Nubsella zeaxanthinifaciens]|jgi:Fur family ferric uptake transcriptional regulator|uniref:Fur family transcriptional regulator n=1 Tax=Nubsella zeaxanthinifaciens TaxID=392412 RepID=UPI000DE4DEC5|nr:transcriptional repressor [Nubsella zeaxanthinifaciens]